MLLNRTIDILKQREFLEVLLPVIKAITTYYGEAVTDKGKTNFDLNSLSNLVECLLFLLSDEGTESGA
jgi:hypothetical protein